MRAGCGKRLHVEVGLDPSLAIGARGRLADPGFEAGIVRQLKLRMPRRYLFNQYAGTSFKYFFGITP